LKYQQLLFKKSAVNAIERWRLVFNLSLREKNGSRVPKKKSMNTKAALANNVSAPLSTPRMAMNERR
jgi:hypothetical protein